jgi:kynurenine formamidase
MAEIIGANGLRYYDLSNTFGHGVPQWPSGAALNVRVSKFHALNGMLVQDVEAIVHRSTHMDAALHVTENAPSLTGYETNRFFGTGVVVSIPKGKWGVVTADDLEKATPKIERGDILIINTGTHHLLEDCDEYYAYSPGTYKEAAEWMVERGVKMFGITVQALDHPLGTKLLNHGPGPTHPWLADEYREFTGRDVYKDFPYWEPCHKIIMNAGIPGIENIGGDVDLVTGKRVTIMAFPWRWPTGEGCPVRVLAVVDPDQKYRIS